MNIYEQIMQQIPDTLKVGTALSAPVLTFVGISVEQWGFALSAIVSILFIIEKLPNLCKTLLRMYKYVTRKKRE
jgi:hypothetical protein